MKYSLKQMQWETVAKVHLTRKFLQLWQLSLDFKVPPPSQMFAVSRWRLKKWATYLMIGLWPLCKTNQKGIKWIQENIKGKNKDANKKIDAYKVGRQLAYLIGPWPQRVDSDRLFIGFDRNFKSYFAMSERTQVPRRFLTHTIFHKGQKS